MTISFQIPGQPVAKARTRFGALKECNQCHRKTQRNVCFCGGQDFKFLAAVPRTDQDTQRFENQVQAMAWEKMKEIGLASPIADPVHLRILAYFLIPASRRKLKDDDRHTQRPDGDNVLKSICDGLNKVLWLDDSQVWAAHITKLWSHSPRTEVEVEY